MKEKFYIFLDIDGVLWDWKYIKSLTCKGERKQGGQIKEFNPESIKALNFLLDELNKKFDCKLVVSSTWRSDMARTIEQLYKCGLKYDGKIYATPNCGKPHQRAKEIKIFLSLQNASDDKILILDDEDFDFGQYFFANKIIKTNIENNSLNMKMVKKWLDENFKEETFSPMF